MKLILPERSNKRFEVAFALVLLNYKFPYDELESIELVPANRYIQSRHAATFKYKHKPKITIRNGNRTIPEFINSLIHELTHLEQYISGRLAKMDELHYESEAYSAGHAAELMYKGKW